MNKKSKYIITFLIYIVAAIAFYLIGGDQLKRISVQESMTESKAALPEFTEGQTIEQTFASSADIINEIDLMVATYARTTNQGEIVLSIQDSVDNTILATRTVDVSTLQDNSIYTWILSEPINNEGKNLTLRIESYCKTGEAIGFYYGDSIQNHKGQLICNGESYEGQLYLDIKGENLSIFGMHYWFWVTLAGFLILAYMIWSDYQETKGKLTKGKLLFIVWKKYRFLIQQLVARDFKTKYKRSVLGYLWSFLNPLLTMVVQYIVFSTIFKSGIDNYPVYLLTGIVLFNFFSEAVSQGLGSIVYNASLITKVYVPKYIYPVTKVASTSINLFISVIPLLLAVIITGVKITPAILLLPFVLGCLLLFCIGMVLMLSAAMVFFRDTQYLWGIVSMVWMYATPLFYPEDIIPDQFRFIQTLNPMYYMVKFARIILIEGKSPEPMMYGTCILSAVLTCVIGAYVFKKTQNKFILYI